ncbi:MAG: hypothetical protein LBB23_00440 [Rickettsiales bacterium]|jgi:hypothetical protein|nr:hypothetical protein [Rickettsiales bacterium]
MFFFDLEKIMAAMHLSPYQAYIIRNNKYKYDMEAIRKRGGLVIAPYRNDSCNGISEYWDKLLHGSRADLIGTDKVLIHGQRGIKVYSDGRFVANIDGRKCLADMEGHIIERQ